MPSARRCPPAMGLDSEHPPLARQLRRLAPYARALLERSADYALCLAADEVCVEHVLCTLMADEDCAAHRVVLHAFADPGSIAEMALATASGIMVVGSRCSLPFSALGVKALFAARELAAARGGDEVRPEHLLLCAASELEPAARSSLVEAGLDRASVEAGLPAPRADRAATRQGPLFKHFSNDAKRVLSAAARATAQVGQKAISPAHVVLACLQVGGELAGRAALSPARARRVLASRTEDATPLPERKLAPDALLLQFLQGLPEDAGSLDLLARFLGGLTPELAQHLVRNKVTEALLERSKGVFRDPEP